MEKIKLIELLNRINNNEITNKTKIAFKEYVFEFDKKKKQFITKWSSWFYPLSSIYKIDECLDDDVYILEQGEDKSND